MMMIYDDGEIIDLPHQIGGGGDIDYMEEL